MMLRSPTSPTSRTSRASRTLCNRPACRVVLITTLALSLLGCASEEGEATAPTQVAAKVGGSEISVHQINQVLGRTPMRDSSKETLQAASNQILERLIDQQLAVDAATEAKLHRSPEVVSAIEAARNEVLARAYLQKITAATAKATPEEIKQYFTENPALFAERRAFNLQEIRIADTGSALPELRALAEQGRPIEEMAALLRARQIPFTGGSASRSAEQIPLELLPRLHALQDGQSLIMDNGQSATLIRIASSQRLPVSEEQARAGIEQFLNNRRATEAVTQEIKRLREAHPVAYMGEFGKPAAAPGAGAPASSLTQGTPTAATPTAAPTAAPAATATTADQSAIERGLQGLK
ncbi:MAG: peptidyl-prolyl cis-trans isomerase, EpsD family [Comamonadaceae bacterium]|nr:peptidyl-prolyl cis-trans isomerase, EpsD family [Comamonadaceae bacterium]